MQRLHASAPSTGGRRQAGAHRLGGWRPGEQALLRRLLLLLLLLLLLPVARLKNGHYGGRAASRPAAHPTAAHCMPARVQGTGRQSRLLSYSLAR